MKGWMDGWMNGTYNGSKREDHENMLAPGRNALEGVKHFFVLCEGISVRKESGVVYMLD